nr:MAG TPA: hypothetical protein [Caudoviricetes sp.]
MVSTNSGQAVLTASRTEKVLYIIKKPHFLGLLPFFTVYHIASSKNRTCKNIFALLGWGGVALRCSPAKVSGRRHFDALNSAEKNQKKNRIQDNITYRTPLYHAEPLVTGFAAAFCVNIRMQRLE